MLDADAQTVELTYPDIWLDLGLEPVMMFSKIYPEAENAVQVLTSRIDQAAAAGIRQVLTFGHTKGADSGQWMDRVAILLPTAYCPLSAHCPLPTISVY